MHQTPAAACLGMTVKPRITPWARCSLSVVLVYRQGGNQVIKALEGEPGKVWAWDIEWGSVGLGRGGKPRTGAEVGRRDSHLYPEAQGVRGNRGY